MERLVASPLGHIMALTACMVSLLGVLIEIVREAWELMLRLFFELPLLGQSFEIAGWYVVFTGLTWALISMTPSPEDDDESSGWLEIVSIEYDPST